MKNVNQNNPLPVKIRKSFDTNAFLDDMTLFFDEYIKTLGDDQGGNLGFLRHNQERGT